MRKTLRDGGFFLRRHRIDAGSQGLDFPRGLGERLLVLLGPLRDGGKQSLQDEFMVAILPFLCVNANTRLGARAPPQPEISSSARLVVRGPNRPIVAMTTPIAAAMNTKTPRAPERASTKAMMNELKMTERRLQE